MMEAVAIPDSGLRQRKKKESTATPTTCTKDMQNKQKDSNNSGDDDGAVAAQNLEGLPNVVYQYAYPVVEVLTTTVLPFLIVYARKLHAIWIELPHTTMRFLCGVVFCFYGGSFPTLFSAIQAAEHGGRTKIVEAMSDLSAEIMIVIEENKKDNELDEDRNGIRDVLEISPPQLVQRKVLLVLRKMNPDKINKALTAMWTVWMSVLAVLKIQFAHTISMSLSICEFLQKPSNRYLEPVIADAIPNEYRKWIPVVMEWIIKTISITIAWYIHTILITFTSSLQGGLIMSRALYDYCIQNFKHHEKNKKKRRRSFFMKMKQKFQSDEDKVKDLVKQKGEQDKNNAKDDDNDDGFGPMREFFSTMPDSHEDSQLDENLSLLFAGMGFYRQLKRGFKLPWHLNLILWPFHMAEFYIKWCITSTSTTPKVAA